MKKNRSRIKIITILSIIVSIISLGYSYSVYNSNNESSGIATIVENVYDIKIENINSEKTSNEDIAFKEKPVSTYNEVFFSITNLSYENSISYKFDITNSGNIDILIDNIELEGIEEYKDNISFSIDNINKGDIIKGEEQKKNNTFTLSYNNPIYDKNKNLIAIDLNDLKLKISFKQNK